MLKYNQTKGAGGRAESGVVDILKRYSDTVFTNLRVDTLLTRKGDTEIDIIAAVGDAIVIVEVKNIREIDGSISDNFWKMTGATTGEVYNALSPLVQNRIHVRSFKNAWYAKYRKWPKVVHYVLVPNSCRRNSDHKRAGVITISEFEEVMDRLSRKAFVPTYSGSLELAINKNDLRFRRSDIKGGV